MTHTNNTPEPQKLPIGECITPGCCTCPGMEHCPLCGYTEHDKAYWLDHRFCEVRELESPFERGVDELAKEPERKEGK